MDLKFRVAGRIARPVSEVFEAVVDPQQLSRYFTTGGAKGRMETGATVLWDFHDFPGAFRKTARSSRTAASFSHGRQTSRGGFSSPMRRTVAGSSAVLNTLPARTIPAAPGGAW